jgi:hypothetical protein
MFSSSLVREDSVHIVPIGNVRVASSNKLLPDT